MKKLKLFFVFLSFISMSLVGCDSLQEKIDHANDKRYEIYQLAVADGYEGTYEEWLAYIRGQDGKDGEDGHTPVVEIRDNGYWYIDGINTGVKAQGEQGPKGDQGEKGEQGEPGQNGQNGQNGQDGKDGVSIISIKKTSSEDNVDTYTITYSDGTTSTFTITNGIDGLQGTQGIQGNPGKDGHTPVITIGDNGNWFVDGVDTNISAKGKDGEQGPQGERGYSVLTGNGAPNASIGVDGDSYIDLDTWDYYFKNNNTWELKGNIRGVDGTNGQNGNPGANGKSAYELYLEMHPEYQGTLEEWMDDLVNGRLATKEIKYYQVSFDSNGGTPVDPITVEEYKTVDRPENPTKDGYTFAGWYVNGEQWNFTGCVVTSDITLIAKWTGAYTIAFDVNGADPMSSYEVKNSGIVDELNYPVRYGYSFNGWYFHDQLVKFPFKYDGDSTRITFKAKWVRSVGDYDYSVIDENSVALTRYNGKEAYIDIPLEINGKRVVKIGNEFLANNHYVQTVRIHKYVTKIERSWLGRNLKNIIIDKDNPVYDSRDNCNAVIETASNKLILGAGAAFIPDSVTSIGDYAFYNSGLESINIPASVTIGEGILVYCLYLKSVTFAEGIKSIPNYTFNGCISLKEFTIPNSVTSIGEQAFCRCESLESIYIPDTVISLDRNVFLNCSNLSTARLPDSFEYIPYGAFDGCNSLTTINIPSNLSTINKFAFLGCSSLRNFNLPSSVSYIGEQAFRDCDSLTDITLPDDFPLDELGNIFPHADGFKIIVTDQSENYQMIDNVIYDKEGKNLIFCPNIDSIINLDIEAGTEYICKMASKGVGHLESVNIPSSVEEIGADAFLGSSSLVSVTGGAGIKKLNSSVFSDCTSLVSVPNMSLLEEIKSGCFANCQSLESITLSNHLTSISSDTFYNCSSLTSITIPDSVKTININAFALCSSLRSVDLGNGVTEIGTFAFRNCGVESVTFGENVKKIGYMSFFECKSLSSITIADGVEIIDYAAFARCPLIELVIPGSVTSIGDEAFSEIYGEQTLERVTLESGVTKIGTKAFYECRKLKIINLPEGLKEIGDNAFCNCISLTKITIPSTVTSIGSNAFSSCMDLWQIINKSTLDITVGSSAYGGVGAHAYEVISDESESRLNIDENGFVTYRDDNDEIWLMKYIGSNPVIDIPEGVTKIPENCLWGLTFAKRIIVPSTVTYIENNRIDIGKSEFEIINKSELEITSMSRYIHHDDDNRFSTENGFVVFHWGGQKNTLVTYDGDEENVVVPDGITDIEDYCFAENSIIKTVTFPESITKIGDHVFQNCKSLQMISIPNTIEKVGRYAFEDCSASLNKYGNGYYLGNTINPYLILVDVDESATELEIHSECKIAMLYSLYKCSYIASIVLPDSVTSVIYGGSLGSNGRLYSFTFGTGLVDITQFMPSARLVEIINNSSIEFIPNQHSSGWVNGNYQYPVKIVITDGSESRIRIDEKGFVTFTDDEGAVTLIDYVGDETDIVIPNFINKIGDYALSECVATSIIIPDSVTYIGDYFVPSNVNIYIHGNITHIGKLSLSDGNVYCYCSREQWESAVTENIDANVYFYNADLDNQVAGDWHYNVFNGEIIIYKP